MGLLYAQYGNALYPMSGGMMSTNAGGTAVAQAPPQTTVVNYQPTLHEWYVLENVPTLSIFVNSTLPRTPGTHALHPRCRRRRAATTLRCASAPVAAAVGMASRQTATDFSRAQAVSRIVPLPNMHFCFFTKSLTKHNLRNRLIPYWL